MDEQKVFNNAREFGILGEELFNLVDQLKSVCDACDTFEDIETTYELIDKITNLKARLLALQ